MLEFSTAFIRELDLAFIHQLILHGYERASVQHELFSAITLLHLKKSGW